MDVYKCQICGHEYSEEKGELEMDIPAETLFADLPDGRPICPVCGAEKRSFRKVT